MRSGRLRNKITFQQKATTPDGYGGQAVTWQEVATRRAEIQPINGKEFIAAMGEQAESSAKITLRYDSALSGINPDWRIIHGTTVYDIQHISNLRELNRELQIVAVAQIDGGVVVLPVAPSFVIDEFGNTLVDELGNNIIDG